MRKIEKKFFVTLCCLIIVATGSNLLAQEKDRFGDERIELLIKKYSEQTSENKAIYKSLSRRWAKKDSTITAKEVTFLRCFYTTTSQYNPLEIDKMGTDIFRLNEEKKYEEAIRLCQELLKKCPYNLISFKEMAYALNKLEKDYAPVWAKAQLIVQAMSTYGEYFEPKDQNVVKTLNIPLFPLSLYEGAILYDMSKSFPKVTKVLQMNDDLVVAYYSAHESGKWAFLSSMWGYFNHARYFYKEQLDKNKQEAEKQKEEEQWKSCRDSNSVEPCNRYLQNYPNGKFVEEATKKKAEIIIKTKEENLFKKALALKTRNAANEYFEIYPSGIFRKPLELMLNSESGKFIDERDGQEYGWIQIGEQIWLAENLNYKTPDSRCYTGDVWLDLGDKPTQNNCDAGRNEKYGRLYSWNEAQLACPKGWRLPDNDDWITLAKSIEWKVPSNNEAWSWNGSETVPIPNPTNDQNYLLLQDSTKWSNGNNAIGFSAIPTFHGKTSWLSSSPSWINDFGHEYVNKWELTDYSFNQTGDIKSAHFFIRCIKIE